MNPQPLDSVSSLLACPAEAVVVIAASAGGLTALTCVLANLPLDFPAAVVIVQHLSPDHPSLLAKILNDRTGMPVTNAQDGLRLHASSICVAMPGRHLVITPDYEFAFSDTERVRFVRPSADILFISAADVFREHTIGVVLTGNGSDGANGVRRIRQRGGVVIAQDQATSEFFGMPGAAIATGCTDFVLPLNQIGSKLVVLSREESKN